jgi:hypothetical protein
MESPATAKQLQVCVGHAARRLSPTPQILSVLRPCNSVVRDLSRIQHRDEPCRRAYPFPVCRRSLDMDRKPPAFLMQAHAVAAFLLERASTTPLVALLCHALASLNWPEITHPGRGRAPSSFQTSPERGLHGTDLQNPVNEQNLGVCGADVLSIHGRNGRGADPGPQVIGRASVPLHLPALHLPEANQCSPASTAAQRIDPVTCQPCARVCRRNMVRERNTCLHPALVHLRYEVLTCTDKPTGVFCKPAACQPPFGSDGLSSLSRLILRKTPNILWRKQNELGSRWLAQSTGHEARPVVCRLIADLKLFLWLSLDCNEP